MSEHGKLDFSGIRLGDPLEYERLLREVSEGEVNIELTCEELTEENAHKAYPWLNPERN